MKIIDERYNPKDRLDHILDDTLTESITFKTSQYQKLYILNLNKINFNGHSLITRHFDFPHTTVHYLMYDGSYLVHIPYYDDMFLVISGIENGYHKLSALKDTPHYKKMLQHLKANMQEYI